MNKCIVLGVDAPLSPATRQAIRTVRDLIKPLIPQARLIVLHVISTSYVTSPVLGMYTGQLPSTSLTSEQRTEAEKVLAVARGLLRDPALDVSQIEMCLRQGMPADEILRLARETRADLIVVGNRGNFWRERLRRFFAGSTSYQVLRGAPCPVMIVPLAPARRPANLVTWYADAITRYLDEKPAGLTIFTSAEVVRLFELPDARHTAGRKEHAAAVLALEHLAREGILCRHEIKGEMRYVND